MTKTILLLLLCSCLYACGSHRIHHNLMYLTLTTLKLARPEDTTANRIQSLWCIYSDTGMFGRRQQSQAVFHEGKSPTSAYTFKLTYLPTESVIGDYVGWYSDAISKFHIFNINPKFAGQEIFLIQGTDGDEPAYKITLDNYATIMIRYTDPALQPGKLKTAANYYLLHQPSGALTYYLDTSVSQASK